MAVNKWGFECEITPVIHGVTYEKYFMGDIYKDGDMIGKMCILPDGKMKICDVNELREIWGICDNQA